MKNNPATSDLTPRGKLREGGIHDLLGYQLAQAAIATSKSFSREVEIPHRLRPVEFTILQLIRENSEVTPTGLARALAITTPGITAWLDKLAQRGLILRAKSAMDGRTQKLKLTSEGDALAIHALELLLSADQHITEHLTKGEQVILLELLRKIAIVRNIKVHSA